MVKQISNKRQTHKQTEGITITISPFVAIKTETAVCTDSLHTKSIDTYIWIAIV